MTTWKKLKEALKRREEQRFEELKAEVRKVRNTIEKLLTMAFENSANLARTNYSGLEMH